MGADDPLIGQLVADRFLVLELLGEGGMGRVYRARQLKLERDVALKVLRQSKTADSERRRQRFHREARAASRLNHPKMAAVFDFGVWQDRHYIAMELLQGVTLASTMKLDRGMPPRRIIEILLHVCEALEAMHEQRILHRDLKPENIMLVTDTWGEEVVKVVDLGLALLLTAGEEAVTQEGMVTGTPPYMSPEQCRGKSLALEARSDIYSLGVLLYEMLCGRVPFSGPTSTDVMLQHLYQEPVPPSDVNRTQEIHPALEALALWALSKVPAERPPSASDFAEELRSALAIIEGRVRQDEPRRKRPVLGDRHARADAVGLPLTPRRVNKGPLPDLPLGLVEPGGDDDPGPGPLESCLRELELRVLPLQTLEQLERARDELAAVVVDLGDQPRARLERLEQLPIHSWPPLIVVGPGDDIQAMTRCLELGASDYVPRATFARRLPRAARRALLRASREP